MLCVRSDNEDSTRLFTLNVYPQDFGVIAVGVVHKFPWNASVG